MDKNNISNADTLENNDDGRLGRLDENTLGYYRRVSETLSNTFDDEEDKGFNLNKCNID